MTTPDHAAVEIQVLDRRVRLLHPADGFRTSMDSVLLAAACPVQDKDVILDLGCGVGGAGLCVLERVPGVVLRGVDIEALHIELAGQNAQLNSMEDRAEFKMADIRDYRGALCDHVICNPPYLDAGQYIPSPTKQKVVALYHTDDAVSVQDWVDAGFHNLKDGGSFAMIHRADRSDKIIAALGKRFGAVEIIPLWPRAGEPAKRVIIRALKGRRSPAILHPGIVLHEADGRYTSVADAILRGAAII
jgi:tRNA1(Val) A37 N6-methylase TrmN6